MFDQPGDWVQLGVWMTVVSVVFFVAGVLLVPWLAVRMPSDYLVRREKEPRFFRRRTPLGWAGFVLKNFAGALIVVAGIVMLGIPGPGWGAIILGLALMSFPGKRRLERRLLGLPFVVKSLNAIRARANQPPLEQPRRRRSAREAASLKDNTSLKDNRP